MVFLKAPEHGDDDEVPLEFIVAIGISRAFADPSFQRSMIRLAQNAIADGMVEGITPHFDADLN